MDAENLGEFKLRPAKNGWSVRSFGETWVYKTDREVIESLEAHMKQIRADAARRAAQTDQSQRPPRQ